MSTSSSPPTASPAPAVGSPPAFWDIAYKQKSGDLQAVTRMPTGPMPVDTIRNLQAWYYSHLSKGERIKHKLGMSKPIIEIAQLGAVSSIPLLLLFFASTPHLGFTLLIISLFCLSSV